MTVTPDGADGTGMRAELIGHRRALLTRPDSRTDAVPLPVGKRGLISATGIAVQGLVRFVYSLLVGRTLPAGFLSATNSAISTALLATLLWPTSLGAAAAKFLAREAGDVTIRVSLARYLARLTLLTSTALGVGAGLLSYFLLAPGEPVTAVLVAVLTIGWSGYTFVRGTQYATGRVLRATVWDGLSFVVAVGGLILVLVFDLRAWLLLPLAAGYLLYAIAGWPRSGRGSIEPALRMEINRFVAWGVLGSLATAGFLQLTMVLAHQTGDVVSADAYAAALTLATPASVIGAVLSLLLLPALSGAVGRGDLDALRRHTDMAQRGLITTVGGVFGVLVVGSRLLVALIWPDLSAAVPVLEILLVASFLLTASAAVSESIRSYSEHGARVVALIRTAGFVVGLGVAVALVPSLSVTGIAIGYLVGMVITGFLPVVLVWRRDRHRWATLMLRVVSGAGLAAGLVALRSVTERPGWLDLAVTAGFAVGWALLHHQDLVAVARRSVRPQVGG
jgi:O-antigen/teichoic acid export membrane protein